MPRGRHPLDPLDRKHDMTSEINPYASPMAPSGSVVLADSADVEMIRKEHARHELGVRQFGSLFVLLGVAVLAWGVVVLFNISAAPVERAVITGMLAGIGVGMFVSGLAVRKMLAWSRWALVGLSVLTVWSPPLGTALGCYGLYLALSKKGAVVFSPAYQEVMRQTPHLKPKSSWLVSILVAIVIAIVVVAGLVLFIDVSRTR